MSPNYCYKCKHYTGEKYTGKLIRDTCKAFPDGIPPEIMTLKEYHSKKRIDQVGDYTYEERKNN